MNQMIPHVPNLRHEGSILLLLEIKAESVANILPEVRLFFDFSDFGPGRA